MVTFEGYDYIIYTIKENIRILNKYRESLKIEKDQFIRKFYEQNIIRLEKENENLEDKLKNRGGNPNNE